MDKEAQKGFFYSELEFSLQMSLLLSEKNFPYSRICKLGLDFQLEKDFYFYILHLNSNSQTKCKRPLHMFIDNNKSGTELCHQNRGRIF